MSARTPSINAVQTRVVKDAKHYCYPQFSTDGLNWFPINSKSSHSLDYIISECKFFQRNSESMTEKGEVVWRSKA